MSRSYTSGRAPNPEDWRGYCRGKTPYTSRRRANGTRRVLLKKGVVDPFYTSSLHVYKCHNCGHWHLGTDFAKAQEIRRRLLN
jgi:hypothetical protein